LRSFAQTNADRPAGSSHDAGERGHELK
jgi:hypothetical protein